ncbi:putative beta-lactamase [Colletotrichum sublineola]|uniref:Putative beta-lactamase n=1 Tax=Colletotrichum sublineola TaxID=1173701 RepID=A0A066XX01_COLSU|nr:putative beta-lactamase [Colletotrichum sublineola]
MFTDQIPNIPESGESSVQAVRTKLNKMLPELSGVLGSAPRGWGLTFMISGGKTGRSSKTAWYRESGIAGMICSQILPFGDRAVVKIWSEVEAAVYGGLHATTKDGHLL